MFKKIFQQNINFFKLYHKAFLSGLLTGLSFIPFPFFTLFFALAPLWFFIYQQKSLKKILTACFVCQFSCTLVGFNWIIYTFHAFGNMNWFFSFILFVFFCCFAHFYFFLSGLLWFFFTKKNSDSLSPAVKLLLFPFIFSLLHSLIPMLFPWNMGYPWLWGGMPGAQTAELWGFRFLNTLFYIFNLLFLILYKHRGDRTGKTALAGALALFAFLNLLGFYLKRRLPQPDKFLNAIVIQNNIGTTSHSSKAMSSQKAFHISKNLTFKSVLKYAKELKQRKDIQFILWSEGSYGYTISKKAEKERPLSALAQTIKIPLITGAISKDKNDYGVSLFVFDRKGSILKPVYSKVKLLMFGEYFPGNTDFSFFKKIFFLFWLQFDSWQVCPGSGSGRCSFGLANLL